MVEVAVSQPWPTRGVVVNCADPSEEGRCAGMRISEPRLSEKGFGVSVQSPPSPQLRAPSPMAGLLRSAVSAVGAAVLTIAVAGALAAAPASAASGVSACFAYNGVRYQGLSTNLEYAESGYWHFFGGTLGTTLSEGCVSYSIPSRYRRVQLRIKADASVPEWRGMFVGYSPTYAPKGRRSWYLGESQMGFYYLPSTVPNASEWGVDTNAWLNEITGSVNCSSSTAMQVACYMDEHNMHGNIVVLPKDSDGDGWLDTQDDYPTNKYYY